MRIQLSQLQWQNTACDALLFPLFEDEDFREGVARELDEALSGLLVEMLETGEWRGRKDEVVLLHRPASVQASRIALVGIGCRAACDARRIRDAFTSAVRGIRSSGLRRVAAVIRGVDEFNLVGQAAVEGVILGTFCGDDYKTNDRKTIALEEILLVGEEPLEGEDLLKAMHRGEILGLATNLARSLVNEPGNRINPIRLAEVAREMADRFGLELEVLGEPEIEGKGMNALLAVARGSDEPARLIVLRHMGAGHEQPFDAAFIGKGVTFDSGGLSLKPADSMEDMKTDKAGACAVLAAMQAIAQLNVPKNILAVIPAVENLPSGRAQRPGDVVRSMSGKTIEVLNTDAEGRLILADALFYAQQFNPACIVDLATLTGACVVALGTIRGGLFSNNDEFCDKVVQASVRAGERLWRLPMDDEYRKDLDSNIADIKNVGERWGGAIIAAKFLEEFVGTTPWCHLDIAGVDLIKIDDRLKNPTGFGVRTLVELVSGE